MRLNEAFDIREYVPKAVFDAYGGAFCRRFVDERLAAADLQLWKMLQEHYGEPVGITINNWMFGGPRQFSGYRPADCGVGKNTSLHCMGKGSDKVFFLKKSRRHIPITEVYDFILVHHDLFFSLGIRRIEDVNYTPTWLHWDTCNTGEDEIIIVKP